MRFVVCPKLKFIILNRKSLFVNCKVFYFLPKKLLELTTPISTASGTDNADIY